ncbi:Fc.00g077380.m01.CDS01 [Cosmosporella sp. VM-42]
MRFTTSALAAVLMAVRPAVADFYIFCGYSNQTPDAAQSSLVMFFNNPPDCSDSGNAVQMSLQLYNDASNGGLACDGCTASKAPQDWDVTRFEFYDDNGDYIANAGDKPHITPYEDKEHGGWGLYDTDMVLLGTRTRPDPVQILTCPDFGSADNAAGIIHCITALTVKNSN